MDRFLFRHSPATSVPHQLTATDRLSERFPSRLLLALLPGLLAVLGGCQTSSETPSESDSPLPDTTVTEVSGVPGIEAESDSSTTAGRLRFSDQTELSGIAFVYRNGEEAGHFSILESLGGGVAAMDLDRDGDDDLCFAGGGHFAADQRIEGNANGMFRNRGNWKFDDVSLVSGVSAARYYSHGIARTDYDDDGFPDFLVTGYGGVELLHNLGDGTFENVPAAVSGLQDSLWSSSAAWADLNNDGFPDLYVAHYVDWSFQNDPFCKAAAPNDREICPPRSFNGLPDILYMNTGDGGFREKPVGEGIAADGKGLGVVAADMNRDGSVDLYVANDTVPNFLFQNDGAADFSDVSLLSGTSLSDRGVPDGSMGVDVCDFNNDGMPDVWVANYERETSALYQNAGNMIFRHVSQRTGINAAGGLYVGWGTCIQDFDLDGDEDLFVSNGHVIRYPTNAPLMQQPLLFENLAGKRFRNAAVEAGPWFQEHHMGRGAAAADLDNDGDVDLAVSRTNAEATLLRNDSEPAGGWVQVELSGTISSREPVGARVELKSGSTTITRFVKGGGSYGSTNSTRVFFGVPAGDALPSLTIHWPGGFVQNISDVPLNRLIHVNELSRSRDSQTPSGAESSQPAEFMTLPVP